MNITGKLLIEAGFKPAPWFGIAISNNWSLEQCAQADLAHKNRNAGKSRMANTPAPLQVNLNASSDEEVKSLHQVTKAMEYCLKFPHVVKGALMPDASYTGGRSIPVGGVIETEDVFYPAWTSADVCCSVFATNVGKVDAKRVLDSAQKNTHFGVGTVNKTMPSYLVDMFKSNKFLNDLVDTGHYAFGTQGDGNHFLYVGNDSEGNVWIVTHHGSRSVGAKLYKKGMALGQKYWQRECIGDDSNPYIRLDENGGQEYFDALQIVRQWTKANHSEIHNSIVKDLGLTIEDRFWNEHNFLFKKGNKFYHAKGATPLIADLLPDSDGRMLVPLNMSQPILVMKGQSIDALNEPNMGFAPHGAGRNISRSAHKAKYDGQDMEKIFAKETEGIDARFWFDKDLSELPSAYKCADKVQDEIAHYGLGEVISKIYPYGCIMAGDDHRIPAWKRSRKAK